MTFHGTPAKPGAKARATGRSRLGYGGMVGPDENRQMSGGPQERLIATGRKDPQRLEPRISGIATARLEQAAENWILLPQRLKPSLIREHLPQR
jgi:hypothetical protein